MEGRDGLHALKATVTFLPTPFLTVLVVWMYPFQPSSNHLVGRQLWSCLKDSILFTKKQFISVPVVLSLKSLGNSVYLHLCQTLFSFSFSKFDFVFCFVFSLFSGTLCP